MIEEKIIDAAVAGDRHAFEILMKEYAPVVAGYLRGKVPVHFDVEDLVQEVLIKAYLRIATLKRKERLGPWLVAIARNVLRDSYRSRIQHDGKGSYADSQASDPLLSVADTLPVPDEHAEVAELERLVTEAIRRQRTAYRMVLYLRLFEGCSSREIAERLSLKESTVRTRLQRGLEKLQRHLKKRGVDSKPKRD